MLWKQLKKWVVLGFISLFLLRVSFLIFPVASVSLQGVSDWPEKTAVIQVCCFGKSESFVSKISVFSNMMFCWFMS